MFKFKNYFVLVCCLSLTCKSEVILDQMTSIRWKHDKRGCIGQRKHSLNRIITLKEIFKKANQSQILEAFGKPDKIEIYERGQKFYEYYYEYGKQCNDTLLNYGKTIAVRFDAIGYVKEFIIN